MSPNVIIVGAGAAGIAAATKLRKSEFNVTVLEASDRIGGRIRTLKTAEGWLELGAQWVHGTDQWLYDYAKAHDILGEEVHMSQQSGQLFENQEIHHEPHQNMVDYSNEFVGHLDPAVLKMSNAKSSVGAHLEHKYRDGVTQLKTSRERTELESAYDWVVRCTKMDAGSDSLHEVSVQNYIYELCIGNYNHQLRIPYQDLLDHIRNHPEEGSRFPVDRVRLNSTVAKVKLLPDNAGVEITTTDGASHEADFVICTVSLGVLKAYHNSMFSPALSEKKQLAIEKMGYGMVGKVMLFYDKPFWESWKFDYVQGDMRALALHWNGDVDSLKSDPEKRYVGQPWYRAIRSFVVAQFHPNVLVGFLAGSQTSTMEQLPDEEIKKDVTNLLRKFATDQEIHEPIKVIRSNWASDPNFLGTYSYFSQEAVQAGVSSADLQEPEWDQVITTGQSKVSRLLFAGKATHPNYFSMVHGALLSGWREADRLIAMVGEPL